MAISTEAIIGIISIFVGLPPIFLMFWSLMRRKDDANRTIAGEAIYGKHIGCALCTTGLTIFLIKVVDNDHIPTLERLAGENTSRMVVVVVLQTTRTQVAGVFLSV
jgi:hypothetical protein